MTPEPGSSTSADGKSAAQDASQPTDDRDRAADIESGVTSDGLLVESGVFPQLLGLSTGTADAQPHPSPHALELLIAPVVHLAISQLLDHARDCHRPSCLHIPPPLRPYARMRRNALDAQRDLFARTLLQYSSHDFAERVRRRLLEIDEQEPEHSAFVEAIESGAIYTGDGLRALLGDDPQRRAQRLGTLLWARGLQETHERIFFELLRLVAHEPPDDAPQHEAHEVAGPTRGQRRRERKDQQQQIKDLGAEVGELKRDRRKQAEALRRAEELRTQLAADLKALRAENGQLSERLTTAERDLRLARAEVQTSAKELARASDATTAARKLAKEAQAKLDAAEKDRSLAVRELATRRREIASLTAQRDAIPTGKDAVHAFLEAEEERIDIALAIAQGGDRQRAEQEHALREKLEEAFREAYPEFVPPRPAKLTEPARLELTPIGGADEIGRSAYFLQLGDYSILVDCGIKVGREDLDEIAPDINRIEHVDAVVLTHAHTDHLGWLPALVRRFPEVDIYCTPETAELVPIMLADCQRHHFAMMHRLKELAAYSSDAAAVVDPYEPEDVRAVEDALFALPYGEVENLPWSDLRLQFFRAGHVLGAASALIEGEGRRVLMGGDISDEAQLTVGAADWSAVGDVDLLVLESTYGDKPRPPLADQQRELVQFVAEVVTSGGSVILPCFGLGRGQEVALLLANAMKADELPRRSVWIDGMIRQINRVYETHCPSFALPSENFFEVQGVYDRFAALEEAQRQPTIIVTTSGMLAGGPAVEYARALLSDVRNRIAFTGYQDEGNPGHALLSLTREAPDQRTIRVLNEDGDPIEIHAAAPAASFRLSAHADQSGLVRSAAAVRPRHIVLVHGDRERQQPLSEQLYSVIPGSTVEFGSLRTFRIP